MNIYDNEIKLLEKDGTETLLSNYKGKVLLVVNTATGCGFTPQYEELQQIYDELKDQSFEILDFPCNQFASQAKGTDEEIYDFCCSNYGITFHQFKKIDVNGDNTAPIFKALKEALPYKKPTKEGKIKMSFLELLSGTSKKPNDIRWNFTKFLVDKDGNMVNRYEPVVTPNEILEDIKKLLG